MSFRYQDASVSEGMASPGKAPSAPSFLFWNAELGWRRYLPRATGDSPERFSFHSGFSLHSIDYLRAEDDFEICPAPVDLGVFCQLF